MADIGDFLRDHDFAIVGAYFILIALSWAVVCGGTRKPMPKPPAKEER